jgi:hypothetical protein
VKALDLIPASVVSLDDPFDPEFGGLANAVEAERRALWRQVRGRSPASTEAWARTRLAVNLVMQGQHRHAQAELTLAAPELTTDLPEGTARLRRALHLSTETLAAAALSVRTEPVVELARSAVRASAALCPQDWAEAQSMRLPAWAWAAAEIWLRLDPDPTPASRAEIWAALAPIWRWPTVWTDPVSLPWLVRLAHGLLQVGPPAPAVADSVRSALHCGLSNWRRPAVLIPAPGAVAEAVPANAARDDPSCWVVTVLRPLSLAGPDATDRAIAVSWHPLARALRDADEGTPGPGLRLAAWREDADGQSRLLATLADASMAAVLGQVHSEPTRSNPGSGSMRVDRHLARLAADWHGAPAARLHLAAARLAAATGDGAAATRHLVGACGLRLPPPSADLAHARALLSTLAGWCLPANATLRGFDARSPRRRAVVNWLHRALPPRPVAADDATQQAELAALAGDRSDSLRWRWEAVAAARFAEGRVSPGHLAALLALRDALAVLDPDHPDLETVHDDGADIAGRLWGPLSADHWWWRGMRALWWQSRGHGAALQALAREAEDVIELTIAAGDRAACACMRELIDSARMVGPPRRAESARGPALARVQ